MISGHESTACHRGGILPKCSELAPCFSCWLCLRAVERLPAGSLGSLSPAVMPPSFPTVPQSGQFFFLFPLVNLYQLLHKNQAHFLWGLFLALFSLSCCLERRVFTTVLNWLLLVKERAIDVYILTLFWAMVENSAFYKAVDSTQRCKWVQLCFFPTFTHLLLFLSLYTLVGTSGSVLSQSASAVPKGGFVLSWTLSKASSLGTEFKILGNFIKLWKCMYFPTVPRVSGYASHAECWMLCI